MCEATYDNYTENPEAFMEFLEEAEKPLYNGCKRYTKLSAIVKLYNTKAKHGMSDALFSDLLMDFGDMLPDNHKLPTKMYDVKKTLSCFALSHEKIHACSNDCILHRKQYKDCVNCPKCGLSRWKLTKKNVEKKPQEFPVSYVIQLIHHLGSWWIICGPTLKVNQEIFAWHLQLMTLILIATLVVGTVAGPKQPGNDIDVYLDVLVEDLQRLWDGVDGVYDAYRRQFFTLKARQMKEFDGMEKHGESSTPLSGIALFDKLSDIRCVFGKKISVKVKKRKNAKDNNLEDSKEEKDFGSTDFKKCWKKKSIFFNLPYWKHLHVRHCLDVMHIEKNVFESLINTLMNVKGKTKDNVAARLDMVQMGVRPELAPKFGEKRTYFPPAACSFTKKEKLQVCQSIMDIKVPEGFSSNLKNLVSLYELKLIGLKSHDCHVLMQHFLPILIRDALPKHVRYAIIILCFFFKDICCKVIDVAKLDKLQSDLVVTLCLLEHYFPPSFFDVMLHLTVHFVREVRLGGPVYFRWMYPFERSMKVLKSYVGSRKHPECCIVQRYSAEEAIEFCSEYLNDLDPIGVPQSNRDPKSNIPGFLACKTPIIVP
ncbi:uncharacterized protein LOC142537420 [Primulina tabacum]|uniref:uncharacterized protein LOC142537420 n=1 Tax=Primulina tabacum TaxID=48773 RepID=UPI003F596A55